MANRRDENKTGFGRVAPAVFLIIILSFVIVFVGFNTSQQNKVYAQKQAELEAELEAEKDRTNEIEEYRIYVTTDEFKRDVLRDKFNYADKNEIVFRFNN